MNHWWYKVQCTRCRRSWPHYFKILSKMLLMDLILHPLSSPHSHSTFIPPVIRPFYEPHRPLKPKDLKAVSILVIKRSWTHFCPWHEETELISCPFKHKPPVFPLKGWLNLHCSKCWARAPWPLRVCPWGTMWSCSVHYWRHWCVFPPSEDQKQMESGQTFHVDV